MLTELFTNLREKAIASRDLEFAEDVVPSNSLRDLRELEKRSLFAAYQELLNFGDAIDFAAVEEKNCPKGYSCGKSCISRTKNCRNPLEGQAKNYADFLKLQKDKDKNTSTKQQADIKQQIAEISQNYEKEIKKLEDEYDEAKAQHADLIRNGLPAKEEKRRQKLLTKKEQGTITAKEEKELLSLEDTLERELELRRNKVSEVRSAFKKVESERDGKINKLVFNEVSKTYQSPQKQQIHGMDKSEDMWSVEYKGIKYHGYGDFSPDNKVVALLSRVVGSEIELPDSLTKYTKDVYFSTQRNKSDSYWEETYDTPGFISRATGGNGEVVFYNGASGDAVDYATLTHEMGHNLAQGKYGTTDPPISSDYYAAAKSDGKHPSNYGNKSIAEDFAETVKMYFFDKDTFEKESPTRYKVMKEILENGDYSG